MRHHAFNYHNRVCKEFTYEIETYNRFSSFVIAVKKHFQVVEHLFDKKRYSLMKDLKFYLVTAIITDENRQAPEGFWVLGGKIELACIYSIY